MNSKIGVMLGNGMTNLILDLKTMKRYDALNAHIEKAGFEPISIHGGHVDAKELHEAIMGYVLPNWDALNPFRAKGGSCANTIKAAYAISKAVWGDERVIKIEHIPTSFVEDALVIKLPMHRKILPDGTKILATDKFLCANREVPKITALTSVQQRNIAYADFFAAPFSTPQGFPEVTAEAFDLIEDHNSNMSVMLTLHGCNYDIGKNGQPINPVKDWNTMFKANLLIGNEKELGAPENAAKREEFRHLRGSVQIITRGAQGIEVLRHKSHKLYPGVRVAPGKGSEAGAGNAAEAAALHHVAGTNAAFGTIDARLTWTARIGNAAGAVATTIPGTTLEGRRITQRIANCYEKQLKIAPLTL